MERGLTRKKVQSFGIQQPRLFNSTKDFFILSLSISTGLLFFTIFIYLIIKISSFEFSSNKTKDSFEGEGENLDSLDDLLQDDEEVVVVEEEVVKKVDGEEEKEEVVKKVDEEEEENNNHPDKEEPPEENDEIKTI
jgi:hypothetical protein